MPLPTGRETGRGRPVYQVPIPAIPKAYLLNPTSCHVSVVKTEKMHLIPNILRPNSNRPIFFLSRLARMMLTQTPLKHFAVPPTPSKRASLRHVVRMAKADEPKETSSGQDSYSVSAMVLVLCRQMRMSGVHGRA